MFPFFRKSPESKKPSAPDTEADGFVLLEPVEPVVRGGLRAALYGAFFQQHSGIQSQEWSAELTLTEIQNMSKERQQKVKLQKPKAASLWR